MESHPVPKKRRGRKKKNTALFISKAAESHKHVWMDIIQINTTFKAIYLGLLSEKCVSGQKLKVAMVTFQNIIALTV